MEKKYYKEYYHLERSHWWFKVRLEILERLIAERIAVGKTKNLKILNAGVATGATTKMLERFGEVVSLEYDNDCCEFLTTVVKIDVVHASLTALPFSEKSFDLVCAFDVIEHIEDDSLALREIRRVLKDDGYFFLTVPAFIFLWSHHDDINHHKRRYTMVTLKTVLLSEELVINYGTYFNAVLFIPIAIIRILSKFFPKRSRLENSGSDFELFKTSKLMNDVFYWMFKREVWPLSKGFTFPFGVSLLVIGSKGPK